MAKLLLSIQCKIGLKNAEVKIPTVTGGGPCRYVGGGYC